ncbi:MAG: hypothetical protein E6H00_14190 [Bacillati bacterium ANGP1]|uniref:Uncharacterized protein n=1 Tax=Candidatus Segetimicrobium genomatis TaxID=2569760 RepID=A0A537JWJ9_9BACT|nr:MAG: hypothetical protein E6H00_14190 [Terrabacteria group bacterium ANGP1]
MTGSGRRTTCPTVSSSAGRRSRRPPPAALWPRREGSRGRAAVPGPRSALAAEHPEAGDPRSAAAPERRRSSPQREPSHRGLLAAVFRARSGSAPGGSEMELRQFVASLANMIWERERKTQQQVDAVVLGYVHGAVTAELEYRRRMHELSRRLAEIDKTLAATGAS